MNFVKILSLLLLFYFSIGLKVYAEVGGDQFKFFGNKYFSDEKLIEFMGKDQWSPERLASVIADKYQEAGFHFVRVHYSQAYLSAQRKRLIRYIIREGHQIKIQHIIFYNAAFQDSSEYEKYFFENTVNIFPERIFVKKLFEEKIELILQLLKNNGFLNASIDRIQYQFVDDKEKALIHVFLREGRQIQVSKILLHNVSRVDEDEIFKLIPLKEGVHFNVEHIEQSVSLIKQYFREKGYFFVRITNQNKVIEFMTPTQARGVFYIDTGPLVYVDQIIVKNNNQTRARVIQREMTLQNGSILKPSSVYESENKILRLGLFHLVDITVQDEHERAPIKNLIVEVKERKSGLFEFGGGVKTDDGVRGFSGVFYKNLGGWNRTLSLHTALNRKIESYNFLERELIFGAQEPYLFGFPFIMRFNGSHKKDDTRPYDIQLWEAKLSFETKVWEVFRALVEYSFSSREIFEALNTSENEDTVLGLIKPSFFLDYRNHTFNPTKGSLHSFFIEYGSPYLGANENIHYLKTGAATSWYFPFQIRKNELVLAASLRGGYAKSFLNSFGIPADQRFYLGGRSTIRGFQEDTLGVISESREILSTAFVNYKLELRFPLFWKIGGALFLDGGDVSLDGFKGLSSREAAGLGVRYQSPLGPLSLDGALILDRKEEEAIGRIHFSIGVF